MREGCDKIGKGWHFAELCCAPSSAESPCLAGEHRELTDQGWVVTFHEWAGRLKFTVRRITRKVFGMILMVLSRSLRSVRLPYNSRTAVRAVNVKLFNTNT
jgi:hypothetical protein